MVFLFLCVRMDLDGPLLLKVLFMMGMIEIFTLQNIKLIQYLMFNNTKFQLINIFQLNFPLGINKVLILILS